MCLLRIVSPVIDATNACMLEMKTSCDDQTDPKVVLEQAAAPAVTVHAQAAYFALCMVLLFIYIILICPFL